MEASDTGVRLPHLQEPLDKAILAAQEPEELTNYKVSKSCGVNKRTAILRSS